MKSWPSTRADLVTFFADRLKVHLREKGARHDLIDAVFALGGQDDLALIVKRVEALGAFLQTDDGANLLAGVKRATNILRDEEKKDKTSYAGAYDLDKLTEKEELALAAAIESVKQDTRGAIDGGEFRRRHARAGRAARAGRCVLRQGDGQCARSGRARQPPRAAVGDPRGDADRGGFFQDCGVTSCPRRRAPRTPGREEVDRCMDSRLRGNHDLQGCRLAALRAPDEDLLRDCT